MELWQTWMTLWVLLIIIELFIGTFDFLALWTSSIVTGLVILLFKDYNLNFTSSVLIFLVMWVIFITISRMILFPKFKKAHSKSVMSADKIIWEKLIVQLKNNTKVVYYDGLYRVIKTDLDINPWDTVEIIEISWTILNVKKVM